MSLRGLVLDRDHPDASQPMADYSAGPGQGGEVMICWAECFGGVTVAIVQGSLWFCSS